MNIFAVLAIIVFPASVLAVDCTGKVDGAYEIGCKSYATCKGELVTIMNCDINQVYNDAIKSCDDVINVGPPCGLVVDCTGKKDGKYADTSLNCKSYYTCLKENSLGHNLCTGGLVFNEVLQTCDWPDNVAPPCGTHTK